MKTDIQKNQACSPTVRVSQWLHNNYNAFPVAAALVWNSLLQHVTSVYHHCLPQLPEDTPLYVLPPLFAPIPMLFLRITLR